MAEVGRSFTDPGAPFAAGTALCDADSAGEAASSNGASIVTADDLDAARALAAGHPYLSEGTGNRFIEVYELLPVPEG